LIKDAKPEEMPISIMLDRYMSGRGAQLASKAPARRATALWKEYFGDDPVSELTVRRQEAFRAWLASKKGLSEGSVRRIIGHGQTALNRAWKLGEITKVPFIELPPISDPYPHIATSQQIASFLNAIPATSEHIWRYCMIRLCTGCRGDAALDLSPDQIDWQHRLIRLNPAGRRQTKKYRPVVPLTEALAAILEEAEGGGSYVHWHGRHVASVKTTWRKIRMSAGLPAWFAPKVLRHTVATELRRRGVPDWEVSGQIGHKKAGTSEIYAKFDPTYLGKAAKALDEWMLELSRLVPKLRGVIAGPEKGNATTSKDQEIQG
jgi:integrase